MLAAFVFSVRVEHLEVLRPIIRRHMIPVMHYLARQQVPAQRLLDDQTVLPNITTTVRVRMLGSQHQPVPALVQEPTASPPRILWTAGAP